MTKTSTDTKLAKADIFRILSIGFSYPTEENLKSIKDISEELISSRAVGKNISTLLKEIISAINSDDITEEYSRLFIKKLVPLNESFCLSRLDAIPDVAGFYKAFGMMPKSGDAPDALNYELEFSAMMLVKISIAKTDEQLEITSVAYGKFMNQHFVPFATAFCEKLKRVEPFLFYSTLADLLHLSVADENHIQVKNSI